MPDDEWGSFFIAREWASDEDKKVFVDVGMMVFEALLLSLVRFVALIL